MAKVRILISLKETVLDPQGKTVNSALKSLGYDNVSNVRVGKVVNLEINETDENKIKESVNSMCDSLLANPVIEDYTFEVLG